MQLDGDILPPRTIRKPGGSGNWRPRSRAWKGSWAGAAWKQVFSKVPCEESRGYARRAASLAGQRLSRDHRLGVARPIKYPADVRVGGGEPSELLSGLGAKGAHRGGGSGAGRGPADRIGALRSWVPAHYPARSTRRLRGRRGEDQAYFADR